MTETWKELALGDVVELQRGYDLPTQDRQPGAVPIVSSAGLTGTHSEARVRGPGVVTGRYGTIGEVFYIEDDFWPLNTTLFVKDFKGNHPRFISYLLRTLDYRALSDKSSVPGVNRNHLHQLRVRVPSPESQERIAQILASLDHKIDLNRRMNQTLEAMAQALFRSWFVDFDSVRAKAEGRQPEGMDAETAALFPSNFDGEGEHRRPRGWRRVQWSDLVTLEYGKALRLYADGHVPVFGTNGQIGFHDVPLCHHEGVIVGRKGAYRGVHYSNKPFYVIDTAFFVEPRVPLEMRWVYYELHREGVNSLDSGSAIPSTSRSDFYALQVIAPPLDIQRRFVELLAPMWRRQEINEQENRTLADLRNTLLPKLLSGKIRIGEAKVQLAATA